VKVLLDAMMPEELGPKLGEHQVLHVAELGWRHLANGELLSEGERAGFHALITKDTNMPYQQNMRGRAISLVIVRPRSQDVEDLLALAPNLLKALATLKPGAVIPVS